MKTNIPLIIIFLTILFIANCTHPDQESIKKIVKTRAYDAKIEFDNYVTGEPVYDMGYDQTIGMDFHWKIRHYDKYDNVVIEEDFRIYDNNKESIIESAHYKYYSDVKGELDERIIEYQGIVGIHKTDYIRDENGLLKEIIYSDGKSTIFYKKEFTYNDYGQKIKEEYYEEEGIETSIDYEYLNPNNNYITKETKVIYGESPYLKVTDYEYYPDGNIKYSNTKSYDIFVQNRRNRMFSKKDLYSDIKKYYYDYIGDTALKQIVYVFAISDWETWDLNKNRTKKSLLEKTRYITSTNNLIEKTYNENGDMLTYKVYKVDVKKNEKYDEKKIKEEGYIMDFYECKYTYNENNEWTELFFTSKINPLFPSNYIIIRDIIYK